MTDAGYMALLPTWWSRKWAQAKLEKFSSSELEEGFALLSAGVFTEVSADGSRPVYFHGEKTSTKLRSDRYSASDMMRIRGTIRQDPRWQSDLQKGVMSAGLWDRLVNSRLSPELSYSDDLTTSSQLIRINKAVYSAAALLCAAWLVSCDPALMFAWRGLSLYNWLHIPRLPVKQLPSGTAPARLIILPEASAAAAAAQEEGSGAQGRNAVLNRWAPLPLALGWLRNVLPSRGDLGRADELAGKLTALRADVRSDGTTLTAVLPESGGPGSTVSLSIEPFDYWSKNRIGSYFTARDEECLSLAGNNLSPGLAGALDRMGGGRLLGGNDTLQDRGDPAAQALALRAAAAMSAYPRLMLYWRGLDLLSYAGYHQRMKAGLQKAGSASSRKRYGPYDTDYSGNVTGSGFLSDLKAPDDGAAQAPDLPGSAPWAESWIEGFGFMGWDDVTGAAMAALREGRVSDITPDAENGRLLCEAADELGEKTAVSLPFAPWSEKERSLAAALLYLNPARLKELRDGVISADLQRLFGRYGLRLLPEAYDGSYKGNEEARRTAFKARLLTALIKTTQVLSADPLLLLRWRGLDVSDGSLFEGKNISGDSLLEVCAPG